MNVRFELAFKKALKKHASIKADVERKVRLIMEHPTEYGEPLKGKYRGYYSCPVHRNFIIIYLHCADCRKRGDAAVVACDDCLETGDDTLKFVLFGPHDQAYRGD